MSECEFCGCRLDSDFDTGEHLDSLSCAVALKRDRDRLRARVEELEGAILKHIDKTDIERGSRMYGTQADHELWEMVAAREEE